MLPWSNFCNVWLYNVDNVVKNFKKLITTYDKFAGFFGYKQKKLSLLM